MISYQILAAPFVLASVVYLGGLIDITFMERDMKKEKNN